jgi:hypothetical protein
MFAKLRCGVGGALSVLRHWVHGHGRSPPSAAHHRVPRLLLGNNVKTLRLKVLYLCECNIELKKLYINITLLTSLCISILKNTIFFFSEK